ncbi:MAG: hypothetical protein V7731_23125 [Amphritea sp.]
MKPMLILTSLGMSLILIGCQGPMQSNNMAQPPLYTFLTDEDVEKANGALQYSLETLPSSQKQSWTNVNSSNSGMITPLRTYKSKKGFYCHDYQEMIKIRDRQQVYFDTACRSNDGNWYPI